MCFKGRLRTFVWRSDREELSCNLIIRKGTKRTTYCKKTLIFQYLSSKTKVCRGPYFHNDKEHVKYNENKHHLTSTSLLNTYTSEISFYLFLRTLYINFCSLVIRSHYEK